MNQPQIPATQQIAALRSQLLSLYVEHQDLTNRLKAVDESIAAIRNTLGGSALGERSVNEQAAAAKKEPSKAAEGQTDQPAAEAPAPVADEAK